MSQPPFVKIYQTILDSSIWLEPAATRLVWIAMLAMADADGIVRASRGGLAHRANVSAADCAAAITTLEAPDPDSRSPEHEGRRIEPIKGGWLVLNAKAYRDLRSGEQIQAAKRSASYRSRKTVTHHVTARDDGTTNVTARDDGTTNVTGRDGGRPSSPPITPSTTHREVEVEVEVESPLRGAPPARAHARGPDPEFSSLPDLSTPDGRWWAWQLWREQASLGSAPPIERPKLELAWEAIERQEAARMGLSPTEAFERICWVFLSWPQDQPLPGDRRPLKRDKPAGWMLTGLTALVDAAANKGNGQRSVNWTEGLEGSNKLRAINTLLDIGVIRERNKLPVEAPDLLHGLTGDDHALVSKALNYIRRLHGQEPVQDGATA